MVVGHCFV